MTSARGNAFLYILIAIALFAGLVFVLSRGQDGGEQTKFAAASVQARAQRLLAYVDSVSQAWLQMKNMGTDLDEISLVLPTAGTFNNAPTIHKLFHPDGGGVQYRDMNDADSRASSATPVGWKFTLINADYTDSSRTDLFMSYLNVKQELCAKINEITRNDSTIPTATFDANDVFVAASTDLTTATCAECATHTSICVQDSTTRYVFVNLLESR